MTGTDWLGMTPDIDGIEEVLSAESQDRRRRHAARVRGRFLKGPVPMAWLEAAAKLDGKALQVALAVRYQEGLTRSKSFRLPPALLERFGVSRQAGYRALDVLERAGLIETRRARGRAATVTVLDPPGLAGGR